MLDFATYLTQLAHLIYQDNAKKGFWDKERNFAEAMMLVVTELSEAVEAARHNNPPSEHVDAGEVEEEIADAIIRLLDWCGGRGVDIGRVVMEKLEYNRTRPYLHGKTF